MRTSSSASFRGRRHRLIEDDVASGFEAGFRVGKVRVIRSRDHAQIDGLIGEHLVERARDADVRVALLRIVGAAFEYARQLHVGYTANHGGVKGLSSETESDESNSYHCFVP